MANWREEIPAILGKEVSVLEYADLNSNFFRAVGKAAQNPAVRGLYLRYYGLLVWADALDDASQSASRFTEKARDVTIISLPPRPGPVPLLPALRVSIAQRRLEISRALGVPHLLRILGTIPSGLSSEVLSIRGAPSAVHLQSQLSLPADLPAVAPALEMTAHATSAIDLNCQTELLLSSLQIRAEADRRGVLELLPLAGASPVASRQGMFSGEVALVTGAATGIGRAAVQSLLERGAAVIGLDIKPQITAIFDAPAYLGLQCDLTDESATLECLETAVRTFGGLDMLVLNAGIFPASCALESMNMEYWRQVMQINLDVNVTLLRETYPLLKRAPRYGRVVINGSRNVPAPGPGAAAYSASKAALNQLGRVAALEWASSGVRVNMLNPHAVFDTGIWTDEVLRSRAAKYGLTVEQYKTNNLLHVELTSRDLGELIADTLGPLFSKTTGAQIPVDGGSDRVI
jgi:NAD(P)-dependent dehydrogenase (short-subunit alcohol dehydrogenase family)